MPIFTYYALSDMRAHYKRWTVEYSPEETKTLNIANSHGRLLKDYLGSLYTVAFKPGAGY